MNQKQGIKRYAQEALESEAAGVAAQQLSVAVPFTSSAAPKKVRFQEPIGAEYSKQIVDSNDPIWMERMRQTAASLAQQEENFRRKMRSELSSSIVLYVLEFYSIHLDIDPDEDGEEQAKALCGRFVGDSDRRVVPLFRSLQLNWHSDNEEEVPSPWLLFVLQQVKHLSVCPIEGSTLRESIEQTLFSNRFLPRLCDLKALHWEFPLYNSFIESKLVSIKLGNLSQFGLLQQLLRYSKLRENATHGMQPNDHLALQQANSIEIVHMSGSEVNETVLEDLLAVRSIRSVYLTGTIDVSILSRSTAGLDCIRSLSVNITQEDETSLPALERLTGLEMLQITGRAPDLANISVLQLRELRLRLQGRVGPLDHINIIAIRNCNKLSLLEIDLRGLQDGAQRRFAETLRTRVVDPLVAKGQLARLEFYTAGLKSEHIAPWLDANQGSRLEVLYLDRYVGQPLSFQAMHAALANSTLQSALSHKPSREVWNLLGQQQHQAFQTFKYAFSL